MSERRAILPIFPLSDVVLFPRLVAPLHVFEPRYRQMTEHALATDRRIAMVVVRPRHSAEMAGDPPVFPVGCMGTIGESRRLPDGRFEFVLLGTQRVRIDGESARPDDQLYRSAAVTLLDDVFAEDDVERVAAMRRQVVLRAGELFGDRASEITSNAVEQIDHETFVNALCLALPFSTTDKQALLEVDTIPERFEVLIELLSFALAERGAQSAEFGHLALNREHLRKTAIFRLKSRSLSNFDDSKISRTALREVCVNAKLHQQFARSIRNRSALPFANSGFPTLLRHASLNRLGVGVAVAIRVSNRCNVRA